LRFQGGFAYTRPVEQPKFSVIIPCFNEQEALPHCLETTAKWFEDHNVSYELIVVDDGSKDRTIEVAESYQKKWSDKILRIVKLEQNSGASRAASAGYEVARGTFMFTHCADAPFQIQDMDRVVKLANDDTDVVVVVRNNRSANAPYRKLTSLVNYWLIRILFWVPIPDFQFVQFLRNDKVKGYLPTRANSTFGPPEILIQAWHDGLRFKFMNADFAPRRAGQAKYGSPRRIIQSIGEILRFRYETLFNVPHKEWRKS
jgi:glycosyltransferase involved in cell wall biosynthesis